MPLLPGELLNKRYRIVSLLGEGPYGAVYRAWDQSDRQHVAIKEYLDDSGDTQRRFRAQARALSRLSHPQLPTVRDHFALEEAGQYLVSDFVDGVSLHELLAQYGPLPTHLISGYLQGIAAPLDYLHAQGQLHLNIKPANIRVTPTGDIFLVDTGLPELGIAPGSSGYAAPEQQKQQAATAQSDIYSLGATLYTLLTNEVPVEALRRESGLKELRSAREVNPDVEPFLSLAAARAMDLRPDVRYETAADFARALSRPAGAPPDIYLPRTGSEVYGAAPPPRPPSRRRRAIEQRTIVGLAGMTLLLIGVLAGFFYASRPSTLPGGNEVAATATFESQVIAAITAIATPPTPTPTTTPFPTPTPGPITTGTDSRMLYIAGGVFRMGNDEGERNEQPSHLARLDPFYIDETEVTNGAYAQCVADGACDPPDSPNASYHPSYYGDAAYDDYPVIFVTWYDADAFCTWREARLPTEAEWEKAAGFDPVAFTRTLYPWGETFDGTLWNWCDSNCAQEWRDTTFDDGHRDTAPVGSYAAGRSYLGVADMLGNVMEWTADWYDAAYYNESVDFNPLGPLEGDAKVIRGGSWFSRSDVTVTARSAFVPTVSRANLGFRCAMEQP
jgi:formylglycine-generating enzyme required for sulfatase activity